MALAWWVQPARLALVFLLFVLVAGTLGYVLIEGWSPWDALYMTVITVTTVGYREVQPLSFGGQVFTVFLLIGGVGTLFYTVTLFVARVVEGGFHRRWEARRAERIIDELTRHFIVCGYGRIGRIIIDEFRRQNVPHVVIDRDPDLVHEIIETGSLAVAADASAEETLRGRARHCAGPRADCLGGHRRGERLHHPERPADAARPLHHRPGRERGHAPEARARGRGPRDFPRTSSGRTRSRRRRSGRRSWISCSSPRPSQPLDLAMEQIRVEPGRRIEDANLIAANLRQRLASSWSRSSGADGRMEFNPAPESVMQPATRSWCWDGRRT